MEVSQRISVTGMLASQRQLEVVSNNLANVNSTGFKRAVAHSTDVGYQAGLSLASSMTFSYLAIRHMLGEAD